MILTVLCTILNREPSLTSPAYLITYGYLIQQWTAMLFFTSNDRILKFFNDFRFQGLRLREVRVLVAIWERFDSLTVRFI